MKLEYLKSFCAFIEHDCSLREAAEATGVTREIIKKHITNLETSLKRKLIFSRKKVLCPTPEANTLYRKIKFLTSTLENIVHEFEINEEKIRLSCTYSFLSTWLSSFLLDFLKENKKLEISAIDKPIDLITEGRELFIGCKTENIWQNDITKIPLCNFHMMMCASKKYLDKYGEPKTVEDLKKHRFILYTEERNIHTFEDPNSFNQKLKGREDLILFSSGFNILQAVKSDIGIGPISIESAMAQTEEIKPIMLDYFKPQVVEVFIFTQTQFINYPKIENAIKSIKNSTTKYLKRFDEKYQHMTGATINR